MKKTISICMAVMAVLSLNFGFGGEGIAHKLAVFYGGWLCGWLFIMIHDELSEYLNQGDE